MSAPLSIEQIASNKEKLREEIRQKEELFKAYELVEKDLQRNGQSIPPAHTPIITTARHRTRTPLTVEPGFGHKTRLVRSSIGKMPKSFVIRDIYQYLINHGNTDMTIESVTNIVNRLRDENHPIIRVRRPGKGRRPTIYERA